MSQKTEEKSQEIIPKIKNELKNLKKLKLEFGRTLKFDSIKIENASTSGFTILEDQIELIELDNSIYEDVVEFNKKEDWMKEIDKFLNSEVDMNNFGSFGIDFLNAQNESEKTDKKLTYTRIPKIFLKFYKFKSTEEFIKDVEEAIKSNDHKKFEKIYEKFGKFVPTEVILGGVVVCSYSRSDGGTTSESIKEYRRLDGNVRKNFNKDEWIKSLDTLNSYKSWECIEFRKPINIFQILDIKLRKQINEIIGKKILYSEVIEDHCRLGYGEQKIVELPLPERVLKTIKNDEAECTIFATVVDGDEKRNNFFDCQIYHPRNERPRLIIHRCQKKQKYSKCELRIGFMIIANDIDFDFSNVNEIYLKDCYQDYQKSNRQELYDFESTINIKELDSFLGIPVLKELNNQDESIVMGHYFSKNDDKIKVSVFSYSLKESKYVELPDFRFHILTVKSTDANNAGIIPFVKEKNLVKMKSYVDLSKYNFPLNPKYISLFYTDKNSGPVLFKQKKKRIKLEYLNCECKTCSVCMDIDKSYKSSDVKCAYFILN
ncbi:hypothetical protein GLOIN_2v1729682 [Rhizophagus clarus]|uniref:DUF7431 domain-containing protein n=1 Tax=Rhizophagus clarus TaxID=94130 RepID=A0A8H3QSV4_9GLOM|nr:hypothetical protein GLOIN_2v1729682 [Rhizophagus clarus]